jgi:ankyrin repeat protein
MAFTLAPPRFQDIAFFLAATGYTEEVERAVGTCKELWDDPLLWRCLGPHIKHRLTASTEGGLYDRVVFLLSYGAKPTAATIHRAVDYGYNHILRELLKRVGPAELEAELLERTEVYIGWVGWSRTVTLHTPLMRAAKHGNVEAARLLLAAGAKVNTESYMPPATAFDVAIQGGDDGNWFEVARLLKRRGAKTADHLRLTEARLAGATG